MVCTEYPPMLGGLGRYTYNLTNHLKNHNIDISTVSNQAGNGTYTGLFPGNINNSDVLLDIVKQQDPDIVHIQLEHGLYGLFIDPLVPNKISSTIDKFYDMCKVPIVTTFHSSYTFKQWMNLIYPTQEQSGKKMNKLDIGLQLLSKYWKHLINYRSFHDYNNYIMKKSHAGIVFSHYMANLIPGCKVIYHGAEPCIQLIDKKEAKRKLGLPENGRIAVLNGFLTSTKGWDIIKKMNIPDNWSIVMNHSKVYYSNEIINLNKIKSTNVINLNKSYLSDTELSLLLYASDVVLLPYKVTSGSGVMFDGLAHGLPFIASDLDFFKEFSKKGLGICVKRNAEKFAKALVQIDQYYEKFAINVEVFKNMLKWDFHIAQHIEVYERVIADKKLTATTN